MVVMPPALQPPPPCFQVLLVTGYGALVPVWRAEHLARDRNPRSPVRVRVTRRPTPALGAGSGCSPCCSARPCPSSTSSSSTSPCPRSAATWTRARRPGDRGRRLRRRVRRAPRARRPARRHVRPAPALPRRAGRLRADLAGLRPRAERVDARAARVCAGRGLGADAAAGAGHHPVGDRRPAARPRRSATTAPPPGSSRVSGRSLGGCWSRRTSRAAAGGRSSW